MVIIMEKIKILKYKEVTNRFIDELTQDPNIQLINIEERFPEIEIIVSLHKKRPFYLSWVKGKYPDIVISTTGENLIEVVARLLTKNSYTLCVAESCTGGLISHLLTGLSGSSRYFLMGTITYSNEAKIRMLNVPKTVIEQHGAVHEETAKYMALGVRNLLCADIGLATTGIAGPTGGTPQKPVGTICISVCLHNRSVTKQYAVDQGDREKNKLYFSYLALNLLRTLLEGQ